jgi:hypothetical protein
MGWMVDSIESRFLKVIVQAGFRSGDGTKFHNTASIFIIPYSLFRRRDEHKYKKQQKAAIEAAMRCSTAQNRKHANTDN